MTRIKNTHTEPLVIYLLAETHGHSSRNRFQVQLMVGEEIEVADSSVSPEILLLAKKKRVTLAVSDDSDKPVEAHVKEATKAVNKKDMPEETAALEVVEDEKELISALEKKLLE